MPAAEERTGQAREREASEKHRRKHKRAERVTDTGTIRGNWFYRDHGGKKSVNANGFTKIERI